MSAYTDRAKAIRSRLQRYRAKLPDADTDALRLLAELDAASALLFARLGDGSRDVLTTYTRLLDQRVDLLTRLRLLATPPRPKVKEDAGLDPYVREHLRAIGEIE